MSHRELKVLHDADRSGRPNGALSAAGGAAA
jgi:hypothetical protein